MKVASVLASALACGPAFSQYIASSPPQIAPTAAAFEQQWARVDADSATAEGKKWETSNTDALEARLLPALGSCSALRPQAASTAAPDRRFILVIAANGSVRNATASEASVYAECLRAALSKAKFSSPPRDGYHYGVILPSTAGERPADRAPLTADATYEQVRARWTEDFNSTAGMQYALARKEDLADLLKTLVQKCPAFEKAMRSGNFALLMELASDGKVGRVVMPPAAESRECVQGSVKGRQFPAPPWDGYWLGMALGQ